MKKVSLLFIVLFLLAIKDRAQTNKNRSGSSNEKCFNENSKIVNIGVGYFGGRHYRYTHSGVYQFRQTPAISISYEQALPQKIGPGYIGVGAYFAYQKASYQVNYFNSYNNEYYYKHNWTYTHFALRAAYHLDDLVIDKGEVYFGTSIGVRASKYRYETNNLGVDANNYQLNEASVRPSLSVFGGGRYYFTENLAVFGEIGYGMTWLTVGLSVKF